MIDSPEIVHTAVRQTAIIRFTIPKADIQKVMGPAIREVMEAVTTQRVGPTGPWFSYHFRIDPEVWDFEVGVPVSAPVTPVGRVQQGSLPAATVARANYRGKYEGLGAAWGELDAWIKDNSCTARPDLWECYVAGPESSADPADWLTELNRPLAKP
jgi:effector-binding domain-containing protein